MGKVKRLRQKYHSSLSKDKPEEKSDALELTKETPKLVPKLVPVVKKTGVEDASPSGNMFAGLQINLDEAKSVCASDGMSDVDTMSVASTVRRNRDGTKKERRKVRHDEFMHKIDAIRAGQRAVKDRKKREKTVIVGDVHPMMDALPSLEELMAVAKAENEKQKSKKVKGIPKQKEAKKAFLSDVQMFMAVNQDPIFKKDPFAAVAQAVENRLKYSEDDS